MSVPRDKLVQTIVDLLKPWADPYQQQDVIAGVREQIGILEAAFPELSREGLRATRESARRILGKIANLKHKITDLQHEGDGRASPEIRMRLAGIRGRPHYEVWAGAKRQLIATKPLDDNFVKALGDMKRECEAAIQGTLTETRGRQRSGQGMVRTHRLYTRHQVFRGTTDQRLAHQPLSPHCRPALQNHRANRTRLRSRP